ncbi:MAG: glutamate-1-semialdehyde 2,1-aminomutase [Thermoplasmata archaeon]
MDPLRSAELHAKAVRLMPGGVSSPVRAFLAVGGTPRYIAEGKGPYLRDVEGREYVDLCGSFGPLIVGHAHPAVVEAVQKGVARGTSYGAPNQDELALAEHIVTAHPAVDRLRFVNSGTEAVMSALRVARAWTGRDLILKFDGCYHGHADALLVKAGSGLATFGTSSSAGVPAGTVQDTAVLPLDDEARLKGFFEDRGEVLAAAVIEAVPANHGLLLPREAFLKTLERLCRRYGAAFVVDEVITGFRLGPGGATAHYGLRPDLVALGKIIGGGLPVGAFGGREECMALVSPEGPVYQAGTLSGNPLAMAAGRATLEVLRETNPYAELAKAAASLAMRLTEGAVEAGLPARVPHLASILWMLFQDGGPPRAAGQISKQAETRFATLHRAALKRKVYLPPSAYEVEFLSTAHDEEAIDSAVAGLTGAFREVAPDG